MDEKMFISRKESAVFFIVEMIKVFFLICMVTWLANNFVYRQGQGINTSTEITTFKK